MRTFQIGDQVVAKTPLGRITFTSAVLNVFVPAEGPVAYLVAWGRGSQAQVWTSNVKAA